MTSAEEHFNGKTEKAIHQYEVALRIASLHNWHDEQLEFWNRYNLAALLLDENRLDDAHVQVQRAKAYATDDAYSLGRAMELQAEMWCSERVFGEAKTAASRAADVYEKIGAAKCVENCRVIFQDIKESMNTRESDA